MKECQPESFEAEVKVARLGDDDGAIEDFVAEFSVHCADCRLVFHFIGPDAGFSFKRPTVTVGGTTLHAPIAPGLRAMPDRVRFEVES